MEDIQRFYYVTTQREMKPVGPPGTGKTLLAKAIAGEAGVPFFSLSGSEFIEMFVGVGASRVRDLFNKAKANSPCLVFIDEIDAVGRQRGTGIGGGNDEREQTLNQLLTEMDGFSGNSGVSVGLPDIRGREQILKVHSNNKKLDKDVSLSVIAMRTPGFSGADLANLMNEAAILAGRRGKGKITLKEIDDSIDRIVAGMEGTKMTDGKSKILVAYHEIGHAVCATLTPGHDPVQKVTLIPRGQARGLTWFLPGEDPELISKQQLFARIVVGLGGCGKEQHVEKLAEDINSSVRNITESAYEIAKNHIRHNREAIDKLVEVLVEKETLTGDEFRAILSEFTDISVEKIDRTPNREMISV
ncbi:hypothetical protein Pint_19216 [Pistacia integerrima]|uniref:Uncharacterized protein n=1 Tax=Pistacia integerrima TaxID=434235 RepID=A0ACC0YW05_9ROSI|nr:hypothetical protein Pint_19216 [Pistacia integerrima]